MTVGCDQPAVGKLVHRIDALVPLPAGSRVHAAPVVSASAQAWTADGGGACLPTTTIRDTSRKLSMPDTAPWCSPALGHIGTKGGHSHELLRVPRLGTARNRPSARRSRAGPHRFDAHGFPPGSGINASTRCTSSPTVG